MRFADLWPVSMKFNNQPAELKLLAQRRAAPWLSELNIGFETPEARGELRLKLQLIPTLQTSHTK